MFKSQDENVNFSNSIVFWSIFELYGGEKNAFPKFFSADTGAPTAMDGQGSQCLNHLWITRERNKVLINLTTATSSFAVLPLAWCSGGAVLFPGLGNHFFALLCPLCALSATLTLSQLFPTRANPVTYQTDVRRFRFNLAHCS